MSTFVPGIDVSHFQGIINWDGVKTFGIQFAFIKATDGIGGTDPRLTQNMEGAAKVGIPFGLYHFFRPGQNPAEQATHFLSVDHTLAQLPPVLDLELGPLTVPDVEAWLTAVEDSMSVIPIVYGSPSFLSSHFEDWSGVKTYPLWIAEYTERPKPVTGPWANWDFWQHSSTGAVSGISVPVDLNWFNGTVQDLKELLV
jgi:lysozyme